MGPSHVRDQKVAQDDVRTLLREKNDRIATLEAHLEAYSARASTAQARLLKTIDVLDALRSQHALEISAAEQAKIRLVREVDRWRSVAKSLEVEKDELKDVVEDLIEKGNLNIDFPEQVVASTTDSEGTKSDHNNDLLAYATSVIGRLRTELDLERQSHCRTVEEANLRTEELEAKVAVREAELERCITTYGDQECQPGESGNVNIPTHASKTRRFGENLPKPKTLSDEDCLRFLESNSARNRSLELEIRHLAEKLERAKLAASTSSSSCKEVQSLTPRDGHQAFGTPSPRTRSASLDPNVLSRPSDVGKATPMLTPASPSTMFSIAQLDNQIRTMTAQMDALVSERTTLIEAAARQQRAREGMNIEGFPDILRVEGECVRLQSEVDDLREQLQHARSFSRGREKVLLREIAQLRASSSSTSVLHPARELHNLVSPQPFEDDIATEESMELVSPLMPTIIPEIPSPVSPSHHLGAEADLVSSPFSPRHASSPAPHSPPTPTRAASCRSPAAHEIERVQAALDIARTHLTQKEEALVHLRAEMERLRLEVQAQVRSDES